MNRESANPYSIILFFVALLFVSFLLRIFYSGYLFEDDGLWFTAAEEILRGKALYGEIYFDKPPGLALLYALLFKLFGAKIIVIRIFTIFYCVSVAWMLYRFGLKLYGRREGLTAAAFFTLFSTTYLTGHMQGLNTDFLMTMPYAAAAYMFVRSCMDGARRWFALIGGVLVGIAFNINPKGVFGLIFFGMILLFIRYLDYRERTNAHAETQRRREIDQKSKVRSQKSSSIPDVQNTKDAEIFDSSILNMSSAVMLFSISLLGFIAGSLPFLIYIAATGSLWAYWTDVWVWGSRYAGYFPFRTVVASAVKYISGYFLLNSVLMITMIYFIASFIARVRNQTRTDIAFEKHNHFANHAFADSAMLIWLAVSLAGLMMGGRFYGHYFFQILPALSVIGGRGLTQLIASMKSVGDSNIRRVAYYAIFALLIIGFAVTIVRFHTRTAILAYDFLSGRKSQSTADWYHQQLNREELLAAAAVRDIRDRESVTDDVESLRKGDLRASPSAGPADYLFVWGYRPELYYWSGLIPASRYLSTQMLTGVPADVHYYGGEAGSILDESTTAAARALLVRELEAVKPKYIVDEVGMFNNELGINRYAEMREFMKAYRRVDTVERFLIYRRRDMKKRKKDKEKTQNASGVQEPVR